MSPTGTPSRTTTWPDSLTARLHRLADLAWQYRSRPEGEFVLRRDDLPRVTRPDEIQVLCDVIFEHAMTWAPGLTRPPGPPRAVVDEMWPAGLYTPEGFAGRRILIQSGIAVDRVALPAVLAHEIAHDLCYASGINEADRMANEQLTDLLTFICGLGGLMVGGDHIRQSGRGRGETEHVYLTKEQCLIAHQWTLATRYRNKLDPDGEPPDFPTDPARVPRLLSKEQQAWLRAVKAVGDRETVEAELVELRRRRPTLSETQLLDLVVFRLEQEGRQADGR
ncbi:MAG: hypothetical protein AAGE88_17305 [Actinomycetota bacterium]